MTSSVLLNVAFVCNFAYLNYIMNFSKVNVRVVYKSTVKKHKKKGSISRIEPVLLYLYMFNICLDPRETCINKGVERSYKGHFVASLRSFCRTYKGHFVA